MTSSIKKRTGNYPNNAKGSRKKMAHADYACCAVCSSKLYYGGVDAPHKESICGTCLKNARRLGYPFLDLAELLDWLPSATPENLRDLGFSTCYYSNAVDAIANGILLKGAL